MKNETKIKLTDLNGYEEAIKKLTILGYLEPLDMLKSRIAKEYRTPELSEFVLGFKFLAKDINGVWVDREVTNLNIMFSCNTDIELQDSSGIKPIERLLFENRIKVKVK